jgi:hypothetical protein
VIQATRDALAETRPTIGAAERVAATA